MEIPLTAVSPSAVSFLAFLPKHALLANRRFPADLLSVLDDERMKMLVKRDIGGQMGFEKLLDLLVARLPAQKSVSSKDTPRIGVHHEMGPVTGIKKNRVGRLRPDPLDGEKLLTSNSAVEITRISQNELGDSF